MGDNELDLTMGSTMQLYQGDVGLQAVLQIAGACLSRETKRLAWARPLGVETLAPPCRYQAAHCTTRDTLYLHGGGGQGADASQRRALLWALDLRTLRWSVKDGPRKSRVAARSQHTLTCTGDNKLVCFAGQGEGRNSID